MYRLWNFLICVDQLLWSVMTLGAGYPDETISSAIYRLEKKDHWFGNIARPLVDKLFFWQNQHCRRAYLTEIFRRQAPRKL